MHPQRLGLVVGQHRHQPAGAQVVAGEIGRQHRQATARQHGAAQRGRVVGGQRIGDRQLHQLARMPEAVLRRADVGMRQAAVLRQVRQRLRHAVGGQVGGRGAQHRAAGGQRPRDQRRLQRVGDAHGQVDALGGEVHAAVGHHQREGHTRVQALEVHQRRGELGVRERRRAGEAQPARRLAVGAAGAFLHIGAQVQQLAAAGQRRLASFGQAEPPRRAVQQPRAQPGLHRRQVAADHGRGHVQPLGRQRQAALLDDRDEHAGGSQPVHGLRRSMQ
mmetsp:Transcript_21974/g.86270  ORF Transcript_21974/g.86270 Transcript_21974/m.86270 type:complete len:275 (-) Transcript_21974:1008-1832(-)